jgi:hypothetical protein
MREALFLLRYVTISKHTTVHSVGKLQLRQATTAVSVCNVFAYGRPARERSELVGLKVRYFTLKFQAHNHLMKHS